MKIETMGRGNSTKSNYGYFHSGFINSANFTEVLTETGEAQNLVKNALVAVEGSFKDSNGNEHVFPADRLVGIAETTNKHLNTGGVVPVCLDHKKDVLNTVGNVAGQAYTKVIQPEDLPNPRAKDLVGKLGLFFSDVVIKARDAVEKVRDGIVTSVSMGLNLEPSDHRIVELSLVPIPAIPNMGLFKLGVDYSTFAYPSVNYQDKTDAFTWEDLEATEQTLDSLREDYDGLTEKLWTILNNVYNSSAIDITDITVLQQYVYTAINGFGERLVDILGLSDVMQAGSASPQEASTLSAEQQMQMNDVKYQDLAQGANTGVQYKYSRGKVVNFSRGRTKVDRITSKYLRNRVIS